MTVYFEDTQHTSDRPVPQDRKTAAQTFWDDQLTHPALWTRLDYLRAVDLESAVTVARIAGFLTPKGRTRRALDPLIQSGEVACVGTTAAGAELFCLTLAGLSSLKTWQADQQRQARKRREVTGKGWTQQTLWEDG